jgi:hypothetical protein
MCTECEPPPSRLGPERHINLARVTWCRHKFPEKMLKTTVRLRLDAVACAMRVCRTRHARAPHTRNLTSVPGAAASTTTTISTVSCSISSCVILPRAHRPPRLLCNTCRAHKTNECSLEITDLRQRLINSYVSTWDHVS